MGGVLIVTGGSRGIGAATVVLAAAAGWDVCVNYVRDAAKAEAVAAEASALGVRAIAVQGDMASEADIIRLFATVDERLGPVTGLVNNAGITGPAGKLLDLTAETVGTVMNLNVVGPFLCAREAARRMAKSRGGKGGVIVNVSSRAAALGSPNEFIHYAASKGAIDSFTIGLSKELAPEGIRVNAVNPGLIETEIHDASGIPGRLERLVGGVPQGRAGAAAEVAEAIVWLLSDKSSYVCGALVPVSGGR
ncbi:oxidoreductase [Skermanella stibiiresistens SB22]|uniref:Oxidoreductase n=1 Tax=Skermanella stibiiresistens SB22 TaxID=1385369 RepID=W9H4F4_9PROT|nr:SDR family oxidoreductase [Skermanella stibiiresistens]EWY39661.1 oxidoreductase [Skermanella stibiiresistens SB22]